MKWSYPKIITITRSILDGQFSPLVFWCQWDNLCSPAKNLPFFAGYLGLAMISPNHPSMMQYDVMHVMDYDQCYAMFDLQHFTKCIYIYRYRYICTYMMNYTQILLALILYIVSSLCLCNRSV